MVARLLAAACCVTLLAPAASAAQTTIELNCDTDITDGGDRVQVDGATPCLGLVTGDLEIVGPAVRPPPEPDRLGQADAPGGMGLGGMARASLVVAPSAAPQLASVLARSRVAAPEPQSVPRPRVTHGGLRSQTTARARSSRGPPRVA